jgi:hypothetical protein
MFDVVDTVAILGILLVAVWIGFAIMLVQWVLNHLVVFGVPSLSSPLFGPDADPRTDRTAVGHPSRNAETPSGKPPDPPLSPVTPS